jgi:hypothetical protein
MHPEIENLIEMALADGQVTNKEREIILRKATTLGLNLDEVEMILDGRIALMKKEMNASKIEVDIPAKKQNKQGEVIKCPSCGAPVDSFTTKCIACDHVFREVEANSNVKKLFNDFQKIDREVRELYYQNGQDKMVFPASAFSKEKIIQKTNSQIETEIEASAVEQKVNLMSLFPVPNSKEEILEFLVLCVPQASIKIGFFDKILQSKTKLKKAWMAKAEEVIMRARFAMKDDPKTLEQIEMYAKQLGIK